ncbi:MAG: adenylate/guanylate cyclase domain-containing protein [Nevskiales bacterium]
MASGVICGACGHVNPPDAKFCNQCGARQHADAEAGLAQATGYTPRHLVEKVLSHRSALEGERKQVTVLFADIKSSVALSQRVNPEVWHQVMNRFFAILGEGVHAHEGTINQYTGDGVMALFGAPIAHEDHARRACLAALQIQQQLTTFYQELQTEHGIEFLVRMGLNSGEVVVGRIGDDLRMDYTAKGHSVGLAARMEQMAKPGRIYLTHFTAALLQGLFELRHRGDERVKGMDERVRVYELKGVVRFRTRFDQLREQGLSPLVGRSEELAVLDAALTQALAGQGRIIALQGEAGSGKSRLCFEFAQRCRNQGVAVFEVHGVAHYRAAPMLPFLDFMRSYFGIEEGDDSAAQRVKISRRLERFGPQLAQATDVMLGFLDAQGGTEGRGAAGAHSPVELLNTMRAFIQAGALREPGVAILENLQWIDNDEVTAGFLDELGAAMAGSSQLLLVTYRPDYHPRWLALKHFRELRLAPLTRADGELLLGALMGAHEELTELKARMLERAGGNPLFIEELVRTLLEAGQLERTRHGLKQVRAVDELVLPAEIQAVVAARIDRLEDRAKQLLQIASVVGKEFSLEVLSALAEFSRSDTRAGLEPLLAGQWIYPLPDTTQPSYAFHQSFTREVAYHMLLGEHRQRLHRAVAELLAQKRSGQGERAALIAHHYAQAGEALTAAEWHQQAAEWALGRDLGEALRHWRAVAALVAQLPAEHAGRVGLDLRARSRLIQYGARYGSGVEELAQLIKEGTVLAKHCDDAGLKTYFLLACATSQLLAGEITTARKLYAEARAAAPPGAGLLAALLVGQTYVELAAGELQPALALAEQGLKLCGKNPALGAEYLGRSPGFDLAALKAWILSLQGDYSAAEKLMRRTVTVARAQTTPDQQALLLALSASLGAEGGALERARAEGEEALALSEATGHLAVQVLSRLALGRVCVAAEDWPRARALAERALAQAQGPGSGLHEAPRLYAVAAAAALGEGNAAAGYQHAREALRLAEKRGAGLAKIEARLVLAVALTTRAGKRKLPSAAASELAKAAKRMQDVGAAGLAPQLALARAACCHLVGDAAGRLKALREAARLYAAAGAKPRARHIQLMADAITKSR